MPESGTAGGPCRVPWPDCGSVFSRNEASCPQAGLPSGSSRQQGCTRMTEAPGPDRGRIFGRNEASCPQPCLPSGTSQPEGCARMTEVPGLPPVRCYSRHASRRRDLVLNPAKGPASLTPCPERASGRRIGNGGPLRRGLRLALPSPSLIRRQPANRDPVSCQFPARSWRSRASHYSLDHQA